MITILHQSPGVHSGWWREASEWPLRLQVIRVPVGQPLGLSQGGPYGE